MSNLFAIVNKQLLPAAGVSLHISDLAIQRGYGIFDFFKTLNGQPVFLEDHLDRLYYSAEKTLLSAGLPDRETFKTLLNALLQKNNLPDSGVRITLTGGYAVDGYNIAAPNLLITQQPITFNSQVADKGIRLVSYEHQRQLPHVKTIDYLVAVWLQSYIREQQADDVLYHWNGIITECPRSNFFIVTAQQKVLTPQRNVLKGITRKQVLQLAVNGITIETADINLDDVQNAREAFITSTTKGILPVSSFNGVVISNGVTGPVTKLLSEALMKKTYGEE